MSTAALHMDPPLTATRALDLQRKPIAELALRRWRSRLDEAISISDIGVPMSQTQWIQALGVDPSGKMSKLIVTLLDDATTQGRLARTTKSGRVAWMVPLS